MHVCALHKARASPGLMKLVKKTRKPRACLASPGLREMEIIDVITKGVSPPSTLGSIQGERWRWGLGALGYRVTLSESAAFIFSSARITWL